MPSLQWQIWDKIKWQNYWFEEKFCWQYLLTLCWWWWGGVASIAGSAAAAGGSESFSPNQRSDVTPRWSRQWAEWVSCKYKVSMWDLGDSGVGDNNNMATEPIAQVLSRYFFVWTHLYVFEDCRSGGDFLPHLIFSAGMSSVKEEYLQSGGWVGWGGGVWV